MRWKANVTVAAVIEENGNFLMIEEEAGDERVLNQPAGHLEEGESLIDAVVREVREETARDFEADSVVGIYLYPGADNGITYLCVCFSGRCLQHYPQQALDAGIIRSLWMSPEELQQSHTPLRSPLVSQCIADYLAGQRYPLDILHYHVSE